MGRSISDSQRRADQITVGDNVMTPWSEG